MVPPGIRFIIQTLPSLFSYPLLLSLSWYAASLFLNININLPLRIKIPIFALSPFAALPFKNLWSIIKKRQEARALGSVPPPVVNGSLPGNLDIVSRLVFNKDGYPADVNMELSQKLGWIFNMKLFWEDLIITSEPDHVKSILATEFSNYEKGDMFKSVMHSLLGVGVFNSDGEMWKFHRTMTRPFFSKDRISHFETFGRHADEAIFLMKERLSTGHAIDIEDLVSRFTLDSATEFLFGHCVHVLRVPGGLPYSPVVTDLDPSKRFHDGDEDYAVKFSEAFSDAQLASAKRIQLGSLWPLFEFWKDTTLGHMDVINAFIDPILREAIEKKKADVVRADKKEVDEGDTLLDHLINYTDDMKILRDEILNIMIAGRDTTAATLTFALYCLAMYPEVMKRLREEILTVVGSERNPTFDELREMKYLRAVINEVLRLYPPVPFDSRASINASTLSNKTPGAKSWYIPARTRLMYSVFIMHRRTDLWGPDAAEFDPDRFLDARLHKYLTPNPFIFLPFNAGPRICLGQQFAYNEVSFMLIRLLQAFDGVELAQDEQPLDSRPPAEWSHAAVGNRKRLEKARPKSHLTLYAQGGLWVRLHEAPAVETA